MTETELLLSCLSSLELPPPVNTWQWGELRRRMTKEVTARPGRYQVATAPYQREPQESFTDLEVQVTVLCWASRLGKTEMENNLIGSKVERDPSNILFVWPTIDRAKLFSKQFLSPMIRSTPALRNLITDAKRDGENTILMKAFPGGNITLIGANSVSGFRGGQAPTVICDEIDAMENTAEGDPIALAFKRAENFADSIQVLSSTPTFKGASRIWNWLERSDFRKWFVACPVCRFRQTLLFEQIVFDEKRPQDAVLQCQNPEHTEPMHDEHRLEMILAGQWNPTNEFNGVRGFWLNGMNTTFPPKKGYKNKLHQMAAEHLDAKANGEEALIVWTNTFKAETHEAIAEVANPHELLARCEDYGADIPAGCLVLVAGADVHPDRIEVEILGAGEGEETWAIDYAILTGRTDEDAVWQDLDDYLQRPLRNADGVEFRVAMAFIDSGHNSKNVYAFTRPREHRRIYAVKGASDKAAPLCNFKPTRNNPSRAPLFLIGTHFAKNTIFYRLKIGRAKEGATPRCMHWPIRGCYNEVYFDQFTAEHLISKRVSGQIIKSWELREGRDRNEALDCRVYAVAALERLRPLWSALKQRIEKLKAISVPPAPEPETKAAIKPAEPTAPRPPARVPRRIGSSGFVGGWKR